jgi:hypothetical protein
MTDEQASPLEQLTALLEERAERTREWREQLPLRRAQTAATGAVLDRLAKTWPGDPPPRRRYVDVILAAPSREWGENVATRLRDLLPPDATVQLGPEPEQLNGAPPPVVFTISCAVSLAGTSGGRASEQVRAALSKLADVEVEYSEPLDLIVVSPRGS